MASGENHLLCALALNGVRGIGGITYRKLIERFGSPAGVFKAGRNKLESIPRLPKTTIASILAADPEKEGAEQLELLTRRGFGVLTLGAPGYPSLLSRIHDPPPVLYIAGSLKESDDLAVAIVGSRDPTDYGRKAAANLAGGLARAGVTVVSGMARGVDSASHRGAIDGGGRTVAVLGSGLDVIYPPENYKLFEQIVKNGAVISSFPMGTKPERGNFPARNRIISGMSLGVVVVQATTPDSGSLITARCALDQNREVFAVPGEVGIRVSRGTNELIKKGHAKLVENFADILEEVLPQFDPGSNASEQKSKPPPKMENGEKDIWEKLGAKPLHIDNIARKCNLPIHQVAAILLQLELKGIVEQRPGKMFLRTSE